MFSVIQAMVILSAVLWGTVQFAYDAALRTNVEMESTNIIKRLASSTTQKFSTESR